MYAPPPCTLRCTHLPGVEFNVRDCVASVRVSQVIPRRDMQEKKRWIAAIANSLRLGCVGPSGIPSLCSPDSLTFYDQSHPSRLIIMGGRLCATVNASGRVSVVGSGRSPQEVCAAARKAAELTLTAMGSLTPIPTPVVDTLVLTAHCKELKGACEADCLLFARLSARWKGLGVASLGVKKTPQAHAQAPVSAPISSSSSSSASSSSGAPPATGATPASFLYTPTLLNGPLFLRLPAMDVPQSAPLHPSIVAFECGKLVIHDIGSLAGGAAAYSWLAALLKGVSDREALGSAIEAYCITAGVVPIKVDSGSGSSSSSSKGMKRPGDGGGEGGAGWWEEG